MKVLSGIVGKLKFPFKTPSDSWKYHQDILPKTPTSDTISNDLKKRRFKFIGSVIIYAHSQAIGIVKDHIVDCLRYKPLVDL
jgi:DNA-3-methyladenine glycosylase I